MSAVAAAPPALTVEAADMMKKVQTAFDTAISSRKGLKNIVCIVFDKQCKPVYTHVTGAPGLLPNIAAAKAFSFYAGKNMANPSGCNLCCCYVCPYMCGCTGHMAVQVRGQTL